MITVTTTNESLVAQIIEENPLACVVIREDKVIIEIPKKVRIARDEYSNKIKCV